MESIESPDMHAEVMVVTPSVAQEWLDRSRAAGTKNRKLSRFNMDSLRADAESGRFVENGESLVFGKFPDQLLDGWHRLSCIAAGDRTYRMVVVTGVNVECFPWFDRGKKRSCGDAFGLAGKAHQNALAAAARVVWKVDTNRLNDPWAKPTMEELFRVVELNPHLEEIVPRARWPRRSGSLCPPAPLAASILLITRKRGLDEAMGFLDELLSDAHEEGSPLLAARKRLTAAALRRESLSEGEILGLVVRAFNARAAGAKHKNAAKVVRVNRSGEQVLASVPEVVGRFNGGSVHG